MPHALFMHSLHVSCLSCGARERACLHRGGACGFQAVAGTPPSPRPSAVPTSPPCLACCASTAPVAALRPSRTDCPAPVPPRLPFGPNAPEPDPSRNVLLPNPLVTSQPFHLISSHCSPRALGARAWPHSLHTCVSACPPPHPPLSARPRFARPLPFQILHRVPTGWLVIAPGFLSLPSRLDP